MLQSRFDAEPSPLPSHVLQIMLSLLAGDSHGYALIRDVSERTDGEVQLGTSTLYAVLKRLERIGWVTAVAAPEGSRDARRKFYRLTASGRDAVRAEAIRIHRLERMLVDSGLAHELGVADEFGVES